MIVDSDLQHLLFQRPTAVQLRSYQIERQASTLRTEAIARVSARAPIRDLFVENPPVEELIARVYAHQRDRQDGGERS